MNVIIIVPGHHFSMPGDVEGRNDTTLILQTIHRGFRDTKQCWQNKEQSQIFKMEMQYLEFSFTLKTFHRLFFLKKHLKYSKWYTNSVSYRFFCPFIHSIAVVEDLGFPGILHTKAIYFCVLDISSGLKSALVGWEMSCI